MAHLHKRLFKITFICLGLAILILAQPVLGQIENDTSGCTNGRYVDWSKTGVIDALQLTCQLNAEVSEIFILPVEQIDSSLAWQDNINDQLAFWLFDVGADGDINLIIDFHSENGVLTASIFDDQDGDGVVDFDVENDRLLIRESPYWSMRVQAEDGWWQQEDLTNYNLNIQIDGAIKGAFGAELYFDALENDGQIDFSIDVIDANGNGRPETQIIQATPPVSESSGIYRTLLMVNPDDDEQMVSEPFIWPFLHLGAPEDIVKSYNQGLAPIQLDWSSGKIQTLSEFVASRGNEGNWFTYSIDRLGDDAAQFANFEAPFAFYDLANDQDGVPELQVRFEHYPADDPFMANALKRPLPYSNQNVRYSWDQDNDGFWDYKIDTIGRFEATDLVTVNERQFLSFDTESLPQLVTESEWDAVTFVAAEIEYPSTEGIYEWAADEIRELWLLGESQTLPDAYQELPVGLRGDYLLETTSVPDLYLSPIDGKLHLMHAQGGMWQVSSTETLHYANLDHDAYFDQWQLYERGERAEQLNLIGDYLLFTGEDQLQVKEIGQLPTPPRFAAPATFESWQQLGQTLENVALTMEPDNLNSAFEIFNGESLEMSGIIVQQIRPYPDGFQIIGTIQSDFNVDGELAWDASQPNAGPMRLTYDGTWRIEPHLSDFMVEVQLPDLAIEEGQTVPLQLSASLFNDTPNSDYWLVVAESEDKELLRVPLTDNYQSVMNWQAGSETAVTLQLWIEDEEGERMTERVIEIDVLPSSGERPLNFFAAHDLIIPIGATLLIFFAGFLALAAKNTLSQTQEEAAS